MNTYSGLEIAVIGLAGKFPDAENVDQFWNNLTVGKNSIRRFTDEELQQEAEREHVINDPNYVRFGSYLSTKTNFDSAFFGYRPDEAALMDPQIRIFHECCWEALEDSGYAGTLGNQKVGLFASGSPRPNWVVYAALRNAKEQLADGFLLQQLSDVTFLSSMVSYNLDLRGPVVFVQTACSSSLTAIHQACNSLLLGECNIALAGGVTINNYSTKGYIFKDGQIQSSDGKCCPFDYKASGTIFGEGSGVVVLRRLKDAIADRDNIHAIIKGSAINNDGSDKVGYTAPSVGGQVEVIVKALKNAGVDPRTVGYVETHGTATKLGDPIEFEALKRAFSSSGNQQTGYCAIGSVKSNIGHLDAASGVAGFIKVVMALKNSKLPATLHYEKPNPNIDFTGTPFYVNNSAVEWKRTSHPLRAGVSSLGVGGTNVHVILEEAPAAAKTVQPQRHQLLTLSAKSKGALKRNVEKLKNYLEENQNSDISGIAYTLNTGRRSFDHRATFVCTEREDAIKQLASFKEQTEPISRSGHEKKRNVVFMFPGQGAQHPKMCMELFNNEPVFRQAAEQCFQIIQNQSGKDIKSVIFSDDTGQINNTEFTQPALFVIEYSLAQLLMNWGIKPDMLIGHSIGEYVAACVSGVFSIEDALRLVVKRGELMQSMPKGDMWSVLIHERDLQSYLRKHGSVSLAAINSQSTCVISGPEAAVTRLKDLLAQDEFACKKLNTSHAFHSQMMEGMLAEFESVVQNVKINPMTIPFVSNVTGKVATDQLVSQSKYWVDQLRNTVRFSDGINTIKNEQNVLFVEVGPGKTLTPLVGPNNSNSQGKQHDVVTLLGAVKTGANSYSEILKGVGKIWANGVPLNWKGFYADQDHHKVSLPTYSFEKTKYLVDVDARTMLAGQISGDSSKKKLENWFYVPTWKLSNRSQAATVESKNILVFADSHGVCDEVSGLFRDGGANVVSIQTGPTFKRNASDSYSLNPADENGYQQLFIHLSADGLLPDHIIHGWAVRDELREGIAWNSSEARDLYFYSLVNSVKAAQKLPFVVSAVTVITSGLHDVLGGSPHLSDATKSMTLGLLKVIGQEYPAITTSHIDIALHEDFDAQVLFDEVRRPQAGKIVSYRNAHRWLQTFEKIQPESTQISFRQGGVYLLTGGLGRVGYSIARYLGEKYKARLILLGRERLEAPGTDTATKIERISSIEKSGGEVLYFDADITDGQRVSEIIDKAEEFFGPINGVIHTAAVMLASTSTSIATLDRKDFEKQFAPKIDGLLLLSDALKGKKLDFCLLTSSISSVLGGIGFGAYSPANVFMDYFVRTRKNRGLLKKWISVNLDAINFQHARCEEISHDELLHVFNQVLSLSEFPQVIVSTRNLQPRLDNWIARQSIGSTTINDSQGDVRPTLEASIANDLSTLEQRLMKLWINFFGRSDFRLDDNFFEVGGDSLNALTLNARINKEFSVNLPILEFFKRPTIRSLAAFLTSLGEGSDAQSSIKKATARDYYPLSDSQQRTYFLYELDKSSLAYNIPKAVRLEGEVDEARLNSAFRKLIDRHEGLRTSFIEVGGKPVQKVSESIDFQIEVIQGKPTEVDAITSRFIRPFDISSAPLLRAILIQLSVNEHILVVDTHHIITDGVSQAILIRDFMSLYNGEDLRDLSIQYCDYAVWQQDTKQRDKLADQGRFWRQEFAEPPSVLELPTDFQRPTVKTYRGANHPFSLTPEQTRKLRELGENTGATMFMTLLSILNVLLSKLSNQEDVTVGAGISGRDHADVEGVIGMFVNTLAFRNFPLGEMAFSDFLSNVKNRTISCFNNKLYPYEQLIGDLQCPRDTSRNPLYDVALTVQNFEHEELKIPGLKLNAHALARTVSKFDIEVTATEFEGELHLDFEYSTDLFLKETIERFTKYFTRIVDLVVSDPNLKLSEIDILDGKERNKLLYEFNNTEVRYPTEKTVLDLFGAQATLNPGMTAVTYGVKELSYRDLDAKSDCLAIHLAELGVAPKQVVGILMEPSEQLLVAVFGVMKAGGVFVTIDTDYPQSRKKYMLEHSGTVAVLSTRELIRSNNEALASIPAERLVDINATDLDKGIDHSKLQTITPFDLAYILYTSGSTGLPKGAMISHGSLFNYIAWATDAYIAGNDCPMALFSSVSFDLTITSMLLPLLTGNVLHVYDQQDKSTLIQWVVSDGNARVVKLTPSHLRILNESDVDLKGIDCLIIGGEQLSTDLAASISSKGSPSLKIYNEYGPTEATIGCVLHLFSQAESHASASVLIGRPAPNNEIFILDKNLNIVPTGVAGELYIGGAQLFKGYIASDEQTKAKLIDNPFRNGEKMYKTGDLAKWHANSSAEFLGRIDEQVKIRGYRIEPGEIECQLSTYTGIREVAVVARTKDQSGYLAAYYVSDEEIEANKLRDYLSSRLPSYMVPTYFTHLNSLPLTANGKRDVKALPDPVPVVTHVSEGPVTAEEQLLTDTWKKVLGIDKIGVTDDFFAIGGDSIRCIQICSRMKAEGYSLTVKDILTLKNIRALSQTLKKQYVNKKNQEPVTGEIPLTAIQKRFFESERQSKHHYNQSVMLSFPEGITSEEVKSIFISLIDHHDALRITYKSSGRDIIQFNNGIDHVLSIEVKDLSAERLSKQALLDACNSLQESIELEKGPLVKLGLYKLENESLLLIVVHHLVIDGVSWRILFEDIDTLYSQLKRGAALRLPPKTDSFKVWSNKIQEYKDSFKHKQAIEYWHAARKGHAPRLNSNLRGSNTTNDLAVSDFSLNESMTAMLLGSVHKAFNTNINDILLAAFFRSVSTQFGVGALTVDLEGHGREPIIEGVDVGRTVGWFTCMYPVTLTQTGSDLARLIKSVKESIRQVPNNGIDYLVGNFHTNQVNFNYLGQFDSDTRRSSFAIADHPTGNTVSPADQRDCEWEVLGLVSGRRLSMRLLYSKKQYSPKVINDLMASYESNLKLLIDYCASYSKTELTPSDFTYRDLSISQVEKLERKYEYAIEDLYPLSPMQEGMLFHSLMDGNADHYFIQFSYHLVGKLNMSLIERSLDDIMARYDILRTAFIHSDYARPLQVKLRERAAVLSYHDVAEEVLYNGREATVEKYRQLDKSNKFKLDEDALMRVTVFKTGEEDFEFIWSFHHILMDGWCISIIVNEFNALYRAYIENRNFTLPPVQPYSNYISWVESRDKEKARQYWRDYLAGFRTMTTVKGEHSPRPGFSLASTSLVFSEDRVMSLRKLSGKHGVTRHTILQCAWGILLSKYNGVNDVVFGSVVSGRPPELKNIVNQVGLFINTIPARVRYSSTDTVGDLLKKVQKLAVEGESFHYNTLAEIQSIGGLTSSLFDHIMVYENYPVSTALEMPAENRESLYKVIDVNVFEQTNYPLSLIVLLGKELTVRFDYNTNVYETEGIERLKELLSVTIELMESDDSQRVGELDIPVRESDMVNGTLIDSEVAEEKPYEAPSTEIEMQLADIWGEMLGIDRNIISTNHTFFELGGDSIKAIRLVSRINNQFDTNIGLADFYTRNQLKHLANHISVIKQVEIARNGVEEVVDIKI